MLGPGLYAYTDTFTSGTKATVGAANTLISEGRKETQRNHLSCLK